MDRLIVTITPPTPNGNLHLGHISGPFLAADVFTRVQRLKGNEVVFLCYSDDYQSYVDRKARQLGKDRFELASYHAREIEKTLSIAEISVDHFLKAYNNKYFKEAVSFFYKKAYQNGAIEKKVELVPYSEEDKVYGYEAFGRGICNYCGHESDASQCENCAQTPLLSKMGDIISIFSGKKMVWKEVEREFLKIGNYKNYLKEHYSKFSMRPYLKKFYEDTLQHEHLDWPIDRPGECGIKIGANGQEVIIHTWFSGIAGYWAAFREFADKKQDKEMVKRFWHSAETKVVHFFGFDCSFSHAIVYPCLLYNCKEVTRKIYLYPNKFLKLEGKDFSTSRGIAIWISDIIEKFSVDSIRFYLAMNSPEEDTTNFEMANFTHWEKTIFTPALLKINHFLKIKELFNLQNLMPVDKLLLESFIANWKKFTALETFSIRRLTHLLYNFQKLIDKIPEAETVKGNIFSIAYIFMALPVHPNLSEKLIHQYQINFEEIKKLLI